jgi:GNAT superfamily N-acetyltransferase
MSVSIRPYRPTDHSACRALWAEHVETQRDLYDDPGLGGSDPGAGFEAYLTRLDLSGMWVAEHPEDGVVGLIGLILSGRAGHVDPVVVTQRHRGRGIGKALLGHVADQARRRSLRQLSVTPGSRNIVAIRALHAAGFTTLAAVRLTLDVTGGGGDEDETKRSESDVLDVHGLTFNL